MMEVTSSRLKFINTRRRRSPPHHLFYSLSLLFFSFFFFLAFFNTNSCLVFKCQFAAEADLHSQVFEKTLENLGENLGENQERKLEVLKPIMSMDRVRQRRILYRLGSSPPRCNWKCGPCTPCKPVHVAVPPGTPVTTEYYPEAWRCKCGNKLYMP